MAVWIPLVMVPKKKRLLIPLDNTRRPGPLLRITVFTARAIFVPIFFVLGKIYKLCFGWLDRLMAKNSTRNLRRKLSTTFCFCLPSETRGFFPTKEKSSFERLMPLMYLSLQTHLSLSFAGAAVSFMSRLRRNSNPSDSSFSKSF